MKIFWISLLLFAIVLGLTAINAVYIHRAVGEMQALLRAMDQSEDQTERIRDLENLWQTHRKRISFTVGIREVAAIEDRLIELKWADSDADFQEKRSLLYVALGELIRQESIGTDPAF